MTKLIFWPPFKSEELPDVFYKIMWFVPENFDLVSEVVVFAPPGVVAISKPNFFQERTLGSKHIVVTSVNHFDWSDIENDIVVAHRNPTQVRHVFSSKSVIEIDRSKSDWGTWASLLANIRKVLGSRWENPNKSKLIDEINALREEVHQKGRLPVLMGTGPGLLNLQLQVRNPEKFIFLPVNTSVLSKELFDFSKPPLYFAGDALWHVGASLYADNFRRHVLERLTENPTILWVTLEKHAELLYLHYPELREQIVGIPQTGATPNFNLLKDFSLPSLDGALNTWLLPVGLTLSDIVYVIGCNGNALESSNVQDFWGHAYQIDDLMWSGYQLHPKFREHQESVTRLRNSKETAQVFEMLLAKGKRVIRLDETDIKGLEDTPVVEFI